MSIESYLELACKEFNLSFKKCSDYHLQIKGTFLINVYPSKNVFYIQGSEGKQKYKDISEVLLIAQGKGNNKVVPFGLRTKRELTKGQRKAIRAKLYEKSAVCFGCKKEIESIHEATIEHKVPLARGGSNRFDNLALAHEKCNKDRGMNLAVENA